MSVPPTTPVYDFSKDLESFKNSRDFTGKVALVTGSSSGIGAATVQLLASLGAQTVVHGRNENDIKSVAEEALKLSPKKLKPLQVVADLANDKDIERLVNETIKAFGKLDILVNNAGMGGFASLDDENFIKTFDQVHQIDLRAPAILNHLCVPYLKATKGTIIQISSGLSITPLMLATPYCVAKAGMDMMTRCLAIELGPHGVRVNTINPGRTDTNMRAVGWVVPPEGSDVRKERVEKAAKQTPLGRIGRSLDMAKAVVFLASSDASFITGANLVVDGGLIYTFSGQR